MEFRPVDPARLEREWPAIAEILEPAVRQDPKQTMEGLRRRIESGADQLVEVGGEASGLIVLQVTNDLTLWTKYAGGLLVGGPKQRLATIRSVARRLEAVAAASGCIAHCICGRDWSRILPDYEAFDGPRNALRKRL